MLVDGDNEDGSRRLSIDAERKMAEISKASLFSDCLHSMDCAMHHVTDINADYISLISKLNSVLIEIIPCISFYPSILRTVLLMHYII